MKTALCELFGVDLPIMQAPMGGATPPRLTAAVSNAGGLGTIPLWGCEPEELKQGVAEVRALTDRPFVVNINLAFPHDALIEAALEVGVANLSFFWGDPEPAIARAKAGGAKVLFTVASAEDARRAVAAGADAVVAQGWEAGGHVRGTVTTLALVPAVVDAVGEVPVVAAGGIADGRGLAAVLALGASGAWIGTRFLASEEAGAHALYKRRLVEADETAPMWFAGLYDVGWPDAPHRVLRNSTVAAWIAAGRPAPGSRPGEGEVIVTGPGGEVVRYQIHTPGPDDAGDIEASSMWAGQGVALVRDIRPAGDIVRDIADEARAILGRAAG